MNLVPIKVECHSDYKADEYPICFYLEKTKFEITEVLDRWYQSEPSIDIPVSDYFKVSTVGSMKYIIKHELESDLWFLVTTDEPIVRFSYN